MTVPKPTPAQAYDQARAEVMRKHSYTTDNETLVSSCSCGAEVSTLDVGKHIEDAAEKAGVAARRAAEESA